MTSNRNEPCACGSGLKSKKCHQDPMKITWAKKAYIDKMDELIEKELAKKQEREQVKKDYDKLTEGEHNESD